MRYEAISHKQFEELIMRICENLFGVGVQGFTEGPDGGVDGIFEGIAENFPSKNSPWKGKTVMQVKHTNEPNATFSDKQFLSENNKNSLVMKEIEKITKLHKQGKLDNYLLVSNRRLTAQCNTKIKQIISKETGIPESSIYLFGLDDLNKYKRIYPAAFESDRFTGEFPVNIQPDELAEVIEALSETKHYTDPVPPTERVNFSEKIKINGMSTEYGNEIKVKCLSHTRQIDEFLADPINQHLQEKYCIAAEEINAKIIAHRDQYESFDRLLESIFDLLIAKDPAVLKARKKLTRLMLYHMFWNCDIGRKDNAQTN